MMTMPLCPTPLPPTYIPPPPGPQVTSEDRSGGGPGSQPLGHQHHPLATSTSLWATSSDS